MAMVRRRLDGLALVNLLYASDQIVHWSLVHRGEEKTLHLPPVMSGTMVKTIVIENKPLATAGKLTRASDCLDDWPGFRLKCCMASATRSPGAPLQKYCHSPQE
jgi:hypothetical protein